MFSTQGNGGIVGAAIGRVTDQGKYDGEGWIVCSRVFVIVGVFVTVVKHYFIIYIVTPYNTLSRFPFPNHLLSVELKGVFSDNFS